MDGGRADDAGPKPAHGGDAESGVAARGPGDSGEADGAGCGLGCVARGHSDTGDSTVPDL